MQNYLNNHPLSIRVNQQTGNRVSYPEGAAATGALITHPQVTLVGEAGDEVIIPLENHRPQAIALWQEAGERLNLFAASAGRDVGSSRRTATAAPGERVQKTQFTFGEKSVIINTPETDGRKLYRQFMDEMYREAKGKERAYGRT